MANTPNYNLYKPNRVDNLPVDTTLSDNFTIIDTEIKNRKDEITSQGTTINTRIDNEVTTLESRIDNIITTSGTSDTEVVDARGSHAVLKNRLDNIQINIKSFGAVGDGVTDDTNALIAAITFANSLNTVAAYPVSISFTDGTYVLNKPSDLNIPSLVGVGNVKLIVNDNKSFIISSNFTMTNIQVVSMLEYTNVDSSYKPLFKATSTVSNISFTNVVFDTQLSISDGSRRASAVMDFKIVNGLFLNDVIVKGYRRGITSMGTSTNIKGDMLHFENVELAVYVQGSDPNLTDTNYARNIQFTNVSHINTQTQSINYFKLAGADTFLFEKCDTITISNVTTEYAVERAIYCSSSNNLVASNFQIKHSEGIKFVGYVRNDTGLNNIADTCRLSNISLVTSVADTWLCSFYFAKNITVKNCTMNGSGIATSCIYTLHYIENLVIENCYAENLKRGFFEFTYYGTIAAVGSIPANPDGNYPGGINGLYAINNTIRNSHASGFNYHAFKIADISGITLANGTYRYDKITIEKNRVLNNSDTSSYGTIVGAYCKGLIDIKDVQNMKILDNIIYGYYLLDGNNNLINLPFQIASNSKNIQIRHKEYSGNRDNKFFVGTVYASSNTEIEFLTTSRFDTTEDKVILTLKHDTTNVTTTKDLSQNFRLKGSMSIAASTDFTLPLVGYNTNGTTPIYTLPNILGMVDVVGDSGDFGKYLISKTGTITLVTGATALFTTTATSGKFALYKDGSLPRYTLRYQTGSSMSFLINYVVSST
jgi:hypothetical protein